MEKLGILRWRRPDDEPDTDELLAAADRLVRAGHWVTVNTEHTGAAASFRWQTDPDDLVLSSALFIWVDWLEQTEEIVDQLPAAARTVPYLLAESMAKDYADRDWFDGTKSPGVSILTVFPRLAGLDDETFFARWHGSHTVLTFEIHPMQRYVRNTVVRALGPDPVDADALVPETVAIDDLLDPKRFYGGDEALGWEAGMAKISADLDTFCDMRRLQTAPTDEWILSSAPWEARR